MSGGWSTVSPPVSENGDEIGSLGSYGAYNGGVGVAGKVTFTAPTTSAWEDAGEPRGASFTYKVNDGTTDSDTKTVTITFTGLASEGGL